MTGGGSGGHITPILAVARELKSLQPEAQVLYIGQTGDSFGDIVREHPQLVDAAYAVRAGKFRRYHGEGLRQVLDLETLGLNLRDAWYVFVGFWQSFRLLGKLKPDVVFTRGGFVSVPVGLAAALRRIPYVTHDSDALASLANRVIARWATRHIVAMPPELYPYPADKTVDLGVPVSPDIQPVTPELQARYRKQLGFDKYAQIVLVTGGGLGAQRLNEAMVADAAALCKAFPELLIVHAAGAKHEAEISRAYTLALPAAARQRVVVRDYIRDLYRYSGAADVVVTRAGATTFAELARQGKACIVVPNPQLTGGHQTKNARAYSDKHAVVLVEESELQADTPVLGRAIARLLKQPEVRANLERSIRQFARPAAARQLAEVLVQLGMHKGGEDAVRS